MNNLITGKTEQPKYSVIYLRVSTDEQVDNYSLETQEEICTREAERRGLPILHIFREEGKSARTIHKRPELLQMLEFCRKHKMEVAAVIVYRLDRISRETANYLIIRKRLADCNITLISASEPTGNSPTEKFVETMLAGFAQMDNEIRAERARNGLRARFHRGLPNSTVPFGYIIKDGYPYKDVESFDSIFEGWQLMATGTKSLRDLAMIMADKGFRYKGRILRIQSWNRIFHNRFYIGKVVSHKYRQETQGQQPPMITEETFYRVQNILEGRNSHHTLPPARKQRNNPDFPLRRIIRCGLCSKSFTGAWSKGKRIRYAYYFCQNRCSTPSSIPVHFVQDEVERSLKNIQFTDQTVDLINHSLRATYQKRTESLQRRIKGAVDELLRLSEIRQTLIDKNLSGTYSDEIFTEQQKLLEAKVISIQTQKAKDDALIQQYNIEDASEFIIKKLKNIVLTFKDSDIDQIRILLSTIFPEGLIWQFPGIALAPISPFYKRT